MSQDNEPMSECEVCGHQVPYSEERDVLRVTWRTVTGPSGATEEEGITHCATCNPHEDAAAEQRRRAADADERLRRVRCFVRGNRKEIESRRAAASMLIGALCGGDLGANYVTDEKWAAVMTCVNTLRSELRAMKDIENHIAEELRRVGLSESEVMS